MHRTLCLLCCGFLLVTTVPARSQVNGEALQLAAWETDYDPVTLWSWPGSQLTLVGRVEHFDSGGPLQPLNSRIPGEEFTFTVTGAVSEGSTTAGGLQTTTYSGGTFTMYEDASPDAPSFTNLPPNPPNAQVPALFQDGEAVIAGPIRDVRTTVIGTDVILEFTFTIQQGYGSCGSCPYAATGGFTTYWPLGCCPSAGYTTNRLTGYLTLNSDYGPWPRNEPAMPQVWVEPQSGPLGTTFVLKGQNVPGSSVEVHVRRPSGSEFPVPFSVAHPQSFCPTPCMSESYREQYFSVAFSPADAPEFGTYTYWVTSGSTTFGPTTFRVDPPAGCPVRDHVEFFRRGPGTSASTAIAAVGEPDGRGTALGYLGYVDLHFPQGIVDGDGPDLRIYELGHNSAGAIDENYRVEVSADRSQWVALGEAAGDMASFDLAGRGLGVVHYVRIEDLDPYEPGPYPWDRTVVGADIDAVVPLHCQAGETNCTDGVDDDGDGLVDCEDPDCWVDMDHDGVYAPPCGPDCNDRDDSVFPIAQAECGAARDANCDGLIDCPPVGTCDSRSYDGARPDCDRPCASSYEFCQLYEYVGGAAADDETAWPVVIGVQKQFEDANPGYLASSGGLRADILKIKDEFDALAANGIPVEKISWWLLRSPLDVQWNENPGNVRNAVLHQAAELARDYGVRVLALREVRPPEAPSEGYGIPGHCVFSTDPQDDSAVEALHELGHALFGLNDEYSQNRKCKNVPMRQMDEPPRNVWNWEALGSKVACAFCLSARPHLFCDASSPHLWRLGDDGTNANLMRAKAIDYNPSNGYGEIGNLRARMLMNGEKWSGTSQCPTPPECPQQGLAAVAVSGDTAHAERELRLSVRLNGKVGAVDSAVIVAKAPWESAPAAVAVYVEELDAGGNVLIGTSLPDPRYDLSGDSLMMDESRRADWRLSVASGAARWRVMDTDSTILAQGPLGAAFLDYCRSINFTDVDCWATDADGDSIPDVYDNCPSTWNRDQADANGDGVGDACAYPGLDVPQPPAVKALAISGAIPNPTRGRAEFRLELPGRAEVRAAIHDVAGRLVRSLVEETWGPGLHGIAWDGRDASGMRVSPGVYFCRVVVGGRPFTRTVVVID